MEVPWTAFAFTVSAALYSGFQWTVRVVVYPQFAQVPAAAFAAYEKRHQHRVSIAVGPLFAALMATVVALVVAPPPGVLRWWTAAPAACSAGILVVTWLLAVPLHRALGHGFDADVHRRLLRVDTVRLVMALAATGFGCALAVAV